MSLCLQKVRKAGEIFQSGICLRCKHEDLSSVPSSHLKSHAWCCVLVIQVPGRQRQANACLGLTSEKPFLKKRKRKRKEKVQVGKILRNNKRLTITSTYAYAYKQHPTHSCLWPFVMHIYWITLHPCGSFPTVAHISPLLSDPGTTTPF